MMRMRGRATLRIAHGHGVPVLTSRAQIMRSVRSGKPCKNEPQLVGTLQAGLHLHLLIEEPVSLGWPEEWCEGEMGQVG